MRPSSTASTVAQFKSIDVEQRINHRFLAIVATIAASGLVIASAGFGATYAWQVGSRGVLVIAGIPMLAVLAVVMALSLEIAKPYALTAALKAARNGAPTQAFLLASLAFVAVTFSLSAELSLMATLKSDATAWRRAEIKRASDKAVSEQWRIDRYDSARRELAALGQVPGTAEVQADIDGLLLTPGVNSCSSINGPITKRVCPKVSELRVELGRAQRRDDLRKTMDIVSVQLSAPEHHDVVAVDDPGATALSTYLTTLGFAVGPSVLAQWLVLVPVLALEIGSALAGVLVASATAGSNGTITHESKIDGEAADHQVCELMHTGATQSNSHARPHTQRTPSKRRVRRSVARQTSMSVHACEVVPIQSVRARSREQAAQRIMAALHTRDGKINASLRELAKELATSVGTLRGAIASLVSAGEIISEPSANGTTIRLAA